VAGVESAIAYLCQSDSNSRNPAEEGRRLIKTGSFSYRVVTHQHYRAMRNEDDRRAYNRTKMREYRQREKKKASPAENNLPDNGAEQIDQMGKIYYLKGPTGNIRISFCADDFKEFKAQGYFPGGHPLIGYEDGTSAKLLDIQLQFKSYRLKGEWFSPSDSLLEYIDSHTVKCNVIDSDSMWSLCAHTEAETEAAADEYKNHSISSSNAGNANTLPVIDSDSHVNYVTFHNVKDALKSLGIYDERASERMLAECRERSPGVTVEEILFWIGHLWREATASKRIRDPKAYVIAAVGRHVGEENWQRLRDSEVAQAQSPQELPAWENQSEHAVSLWHVILAELQKIIIRRTFDTWLKPTDGWDLCGETLYVRVPSPEFRHLGEKYGEQITNAIRQQHLEIGGVEFVSRPEEVRHELRTPRMSEVRHIS
jgi:hypothetical protein